MNKFPLLLGKETLNKVSHIGEEHKNGRTTLVGAEDFNKKGIITKEEWGGKWIESIAYVY